MHISKCELYEYDQQLIIPMPRTETTTRRGIYVRLILNDGSDAYGEIAPLPGFSGETLEEATEQALQLARQMSETPLSEESPDYAISESGGFSPSVLCGFELALWKLRTFGGRSGMKPGSQLLDGWPPIERSHIDVCALLSGSTHEVITQARLRLRQGYTTFKLKVGNVDPEQDISLIRKVSEIVGRGSRLRLDANRAWSGDEAEHVLKNTSEIDFEYVEEPLRDPSGYPALAAASAVRVALDESTDILLTEDVLKAANIPEEFPWLRVLVLKPMIRGGFLKSMQLARKAHRSGIESVVSSSFESRIGLEGLMLFAGSLPGEGLAAGLDTLYYFQTESKIEHPPILNVETLKNCPPASGISLTRIL